DDYAAVYLLVHLLEHGDEVREAPEVDAGLRLVEYGELGAPGQYGGYLYALELAAGEAGVDLAVYIISGAHAHPGQVLAGLAHAYLPPGGIAQQVVDRDALEAHRLLEGEADALFRPLRHHQRGYVLPVEQYLPLGRLYYAGDYPGQGG